MSARHSLTPAGTGKGAMTGLASCWGACYPAASRMKGTSVAHPVGRGRRAQAVAEKIEEQAALKFKLNVCRDSADSEV